MRRPRKKRRAPSASRALRHEARTDEFLDAALRVVARDGLDALTIGTLARELDASAGALYRYFPGKDDLLAALQERALDALARELEDAAAANPTPPLTKLVSVLEAVATLPERDPPRARLLDALMSAPSPLYDEARARALEVHLVQVLGVVEQALTDAAALGSIEPGDAALRTRILWATLHGASHLTKRDRLEPSTRRARAVERAALTSLLLGFGALEGHVTAVMHLWPQ